MPERSQICVGTSAAIGKFACKHPCAANQDLRRLKEFFVMLNSYIAILSTYGINVQSAKSGKKHFDSL